MITACRLPMLDGNTQDGRQYVDGQGVIQEYDLETKAYVNKGVIKVPPLVNEQTDGLIFPKLFDRLRLIETYKDWLKANIKLETSLLPFPYFYFLDSSDDLIRFYGEDVQTIRIEVDRGRLFQKILRNFCVGGLGDVGAEGERGLAGKPAAKERKVSTKFLSDVEATFSTEIGIPLDTAISIRLYDKYDQKISEIIIELIGSSGGSNGGITIYNYTEDLIIDPSSVITLGVDSQLTALSIQAEIKLSKGKFDKHYFKARQTGPQGEDGSDGTNFLEVRTKNDGDASIVATSAIVNIRKSATTTDMFYRKQSLAENACVAGLTPVNGLPRDVIENALWVSLLPTARECKDIVYERFTPVISEPPLNLPYWTPMKQCADRLRFTIAKFEWQDQITPENRCGVLPFNILTDPRPPELCCAQDLFWCPNLGDACPIEGTIQPIVRFEEEECPCDCTPRTDPMLFSGETVTNVYPCSINGKMHEYRQELEILNVTETKITISVTKGTFCDADEYTKFLVDPCPIKTNVIPTCLSEEMTQNPDGILAINDFGSTSLTISGAGTLRLDVQVNLDAAVCCQGYDLTIKAEAVQVEPTPGPAPIPPVPPTSSQSSYSSSSSGSSSSSSGSSSSSSSSSSSFSSVAPSFPQIILTISGLYGGDTYLGLGNGVHTVSPVAYLPASPEAWAGGTFNEHLVFYANSYYPYSAARLRMLLGTTAWNGLTAEFYTSNYYVSSHYLTSYYFPFTSGAITSKVKNRCFGQLSTSSRITISWQRAPNWPTNPPVPSYTITPSAGANGTIAPSTAQVVNQGGSRLFTITPSPGYKINDVLVDGGSVGAVSDYTFTGVAADHTISASFVVDPVPQMLLTISNLPIGQTNFGLWNGVYAVTPTFYQAAPYEVWYRNNAWDYMLANANPFGGRTSAWAATMWGSVHATFFNTYFAATSVSLSSFYFPFTLGSVTTKIKNRAFGTITTTSGGIISWQRAPNWPSNP